MPCIPWFVLTWYTCIANVLSNQFHLRCLTRVLWHCLQGYYGVYGGQQFSPYYTTGGASGTPGMFQHNFYPFYTPYAQSSQAHGFGIQYPQMVQYPYLPQQFGSTGILSLPSSVAMATTTAGDHSNNFPDLFMNQIYPFDASLLNIRLMTGSFECNLQQVQPQWLWQLLQQQQ